MSSCACSGVNATTAPKSSNLDHSFCLVSCRAFALLEAQTHNECSSEPSYLALLHLQSRQENYSTWHVHLLDLALVALCLSDVLFRNVLVEKLESRLNDHTH